MSGKESNIKIKRDRLEFAMDLSGFGQSSLVREARKRYPEKARNLRTYQRNLKEETIDSEYLDILCEIMDISPEYIKDSESYRTKQKKTTERFLTQSDQKRIDPSGNYAEHYFFGLFNESEDESISLLERYIMKHLENAEILNPDGFNNTALWIHFINDRVERLQRKIDRVIDDSYDDFYYALTDKKEGD